MTRITVVMTDKANYGRLRAFLDACVAHPQLCLSIVVGGTLTTTRSIDVFEAIKYRYEKELKPKTPILEVHQSVDSRTVQGRVATISAGIDGFSAAFIRTKPRFVVCIGDRHETLSSVLAAAYQNMNVVHFQGGEISGTIDDMTRYVITEMASYHVPASYEAKARLEMGGHSEILDIGCPSADIVRDIKRPEVPDGPIVINHHPCSWDPPWLFREMMENVALTGQKAMVQWQGVELGSEEINAVIRDFRGQITPFQPYCPEEYYRLLANANICVGNSSSFVRDSAYFGTPVLLVGSRQVGRERAANAIDVTMETIRDEIYKYAGQTISVKNPYDHGPVSQRVADQLATLKPRTIWHGGQLDLQHL